MVMCCGAFPVVLGYGLWYSRNHGAVVSRISLLFSGEGRSFVLPPVVGTGVSVFRQRRAQVRTGSSRPCRYRVTE